MKTYLISYFKNKIMMRLTCLKRKQSLEQMKKENREAND